jgi:hypothetical protein
MMRFWKESFVATIALTALLAFASAPSASARGFRGGYGRGWYGGPAIGWGWGWGCPGWYGYGYGPGWGYEYVPNTGEVKIVSHDKGDSVWVDGGYAGDLPKAKKLTLSPGNHEISLRAPSGDTLFDQQVDVQRGRTTELHVGG